MLPLDLGLGAQAVGAAALVGTAGTAVVGGSRYTTMAANGGLENEHLLKVKNDDSTPLRSISSKDFKSSDDSNNAYDRSEKNSDSYSQN